jgi:hypothetical protein
LDIFFQSKKIRHRSKNPELMPFRSDGRQMN